jgi:AAA domain
VTGKGWVWEPSAEEEKVTKDDFIQRVIKIESQYGFLTSDYFWELEAIADELKRPSKFLQNIYNRHLSENVDFKAKTLSELLAATPEEIPWLIPDLLYRGSTTIFHAAGGCGKTLLVYNLIKSLTDGVAFLGKRPMGKVNCGIIQIDEPERVLIERAREIDLDGNLTVVTEWSATLVPQLEKMIKERDLGALFIDSFFASQKFAETRENDSDHAAVLMRLRDVAQRTNCAIVIVHHSNKQGGARGSGAITGAVSEVWHLYAPDPELHKQYKMKPSERIFESDKTRMCTPFKIAIALNGEGLQWNSLGDLTKVDDGSLNEPASVIERIKAWVSTREKPFTLTELIEDRTMATLERETVSRTLRRLQSKGFVVRLVPSQGRNETIFIPSHVSVFECPGVRDEPESLDTQEETSRTTARTTPEMLSGQPDAVRESDHPGQHRTNQVVREAVRDAVRDSKALPVKYLEPNPDTRTTENELFSRITSNGENKAGLASPHKPRMPYAGPPEGAIVRFVNEGLSAAEIKRMNGQGIGYPWGAHGVVSVIVKGTNRHEVIVTVDGSQTYVVNNFNAIEVLELPTDFQGVETSDSPFQSVERQGILGDDLIEVDL